MQVSTRRHSRVELPGMQGQSILNLGQAHLGAWRVPPPQCALSRCSVGFQRQRDPRSAPRGSPRADGRHEARGARAGRRGGSHGAAGASWSSNGATASCLDAAGASAQSSARSPTTDA